jgi:hypothetical protein
LKFSPHSMFVPSITMTLLYIGTRYGGSWKFCPKLLLVIFFRPPGGHSIYKKPFKLI